jgi:fumarate hydratase subunit alpha
MLEDIIENTAVDLLRLAATELSLDVKTAIRRALKQERTEVAKTQLRTMIKNFELAENTGTPMCQDTGTITFYLTVGEMFPSLSLLPLILRRATKHATEVIPLRPNAVNPFTGKNSGDNSGHLLPPIHWKIVPGNTLHITAFLKGGGSENMCKLGLLNPGVSLDGVKRFVIDAVITAGGRPCTPLILGIGIGGGADVALNLAKEALLRPMDECHEDPEVAKLEHELLALTNLTGVGPLGLGGDTTVLGVNVEYAHRHPASLPVGIAFQCWAARKAAAQISSDGQVEYLLHNVKER